MTAIDMRGQRYGRLLAIEPVKPGKGGMVWRFVCECGNSHEASGYHVRKGRINSCGCYRREVVKTPGGRRTYNRELLEVRFWRHVREAESGCWEWTASLNKKGYGQVFVDRTIVQRMQPAHRVAYVLMIGEIPPGLELDHLCRNKRCVNPYHLEPVTGAENMRRMARAHDRCKRGHEWTPENTYLTPNGRRQCKTCIRLRSASAGAKAS